jgi:hypothetical protein
MVWYGADECPVDADATVEIVLINNRVFTNEIAGDWRWSHYRDAMDIVEYRTIKTVRPA